MKIITASKFYYPRAGLESYMFKITDTLRAYGHEVIPFSTNYKENIHNEYERFFTEYIDLGGDQKISAYDKYRALLKIFYNIDARNKFAQLLDYTQPDLIWGFGIHRHISPSIFMEAHKRSIPVIHRLSDYSIICPDSRLTKGDDTNCDELLCPLKGYYNAVKYGCVRQASLDDSSKKPSLPASAVGAMELFLHNKFKFYVNNVDQFIAPSNCLREIMIRSGIPEHKITHIPIYIDSGKYTPEFTSQPYLLYFGRLSREKGLPLLLEAMTNLKSHRLLIVGDGPQRNYLEQLKEQYNLDNVEFLGKLYGEDLNNIVKNSRFVVIPSTWFENSPNVLLESYALGKPVLAANIGGIPEYVEENINGLLYKYDCLKELTEKIDYLMNNPDFCTNMGKEARNIVEQKYNPENHYQQVINVIGNVIQPDLNVINTIDSIIQSKQNIIKNSEDVSKGISYHPDTK
ncbi:MAG: glycosyltransferase family 4 protein [Candidatus Gastranaerophilales bacterium]|nr:glycosyltransferase family 4 protein [Candidatus Gastranaerophilales bacterium]